MKREYSISAECTSQYTHLCAQESEICIFFPLIYIFGRAIKFCRPSPALSQFSHSVFAPSQRHVVFITFCTSISMCPCSVLQRHRHSARTHSTLFLSCFAQTYEIQMDIYFRHTKVTSKMGIYLTRTLISMKA